MQRQTARAPELALPVPSLAAMRTALEDECGADAAARALRSAGFAAGNALHAALASAMDGLSVDELNADAFWKRLSLLFSSRGWGNLSHSQLHTGVGALEASNWVESVPESGAQRPSCHFTTGLLANLLGNAADSDVAVLEVECRSRGDARCRFIYGAPDTLGAVYQQVRDGSDAEQSIAALG